MFAAPAAGFFVAGKTDQGTATAGTAATLSFPPPHRALRMFGDPILSVERFHPGALMGACPDPADADPLHATCRLVFCIAPRIS